MNKQSVEYDAGQATSRTLQATRQLDSGLNPTSEPESVESQDGNSFMHHSIVLGQKDKEAFIEMLNRPAQVNQKLFEGFSKVI